MRTRFPENILMIHEMRPGMNIPKDVTLTFDDGLYTQYLYGRDLPNKKIFFISTNIICDGPQSDEFIRAADAHVKAFDGNKENYMTVEQIRELREMGCEIGGHSHFHKDLNTFSTLVKKAQHIREDTERMLSWFSINLQYLPVSFCFPYNYDFQGLYAGLLRRYGFTRVYGSERINIDDILV